MGRTSKKWLLTLLGLAVIAFAGCGRITQKTVYIRLDKPDGLDQQQKAEIDRNFGRYRDAAAKTLRNRFGAAGMYFTRVSPRIGNHLEVKTVVIGEKGERRLENLLKHLNGRLEFRLVHENNDWLVNTYLIEFRAKNPIGDKADEQKFLKAKTPPGYEFMTVYEMDADSPKLRYYYVSQRVEMDGSSVSMASAGKDQWGNPKINLRLNSNGALDFAKVTRRNAGRQLAVVINGRLYCAPTIMAEITGGSAEITGNFSEEETEAIAAALTGGSCPLDFTAVDYVPPVD